MQETAHFFHQLERPALEARVVGPTVWLRGWVVGKSGFDFTDIRVSCVTGVHLGVLGLPRTDLAAHFKSERDWLPAGYVIGVPLPEGRAELAIEAMDEYGNWHSLQSLALTVAADGEPNPRVEGEVALHAGGSLTVRVPHLPFHGHLDQPESQPTVRDGQCKIFGWLLHADQPVRSVFATLDGLGFNVLECGLSDESLASKVPQHPAAVRARARGAVDAPPTLPALACLRVYAELDDATIHLCFARRIAPSVERHSAVTGSGAERADDFVDSENPSAVLSKPPAYPSGRPRRLLIVVRTLQPDDATWRALDVARHLIASHQWAPRIVASEDGELHDAFEACGCPVQTVDPRHYFAANRPSDSEAALKILGRAIWWKHLDAVASFDPASRWVSELARRQAIPVFADPADALAWFSPVPLFQPTPQGKLFAPIRGRAADGAQVLMQAADQLVRHHSAVFSDRSVIMTDGRDTTEEILFRASVAMTFPTASPVSIEAMRGRASAAGVICPAFSSHPHRFLLSALAGGVPLITTPSPLLCATFGANEVAWCATGNPLSLANAIADLLTNPEAASRRAAAAARIAEASYSPGRQLPRWQAMLEDTIGR